jgi:hypothetical protein
MIDIIEKILTNFENQKFQAILSDWIVKESLN